MATREQMLEMAKKAGLDDAAAVAKVDAFLARKAQPAPAPVVTGSAVDRAKPAPKAAPKAPAERPADVMRFDDEFIRGTPPTRAGPAAPPTATTDANGNTRVSARDYVATADAAPMPRNGPPPSVARSFTGMGEHRLNEEQNRKGEAGAEVEGMRAALLSRYGADPRKRAAIEAATDPADIRKTFDAMAPQ